MEKMKMEDVVEGLKGMYEVDPAVENVSGLIEAFRGADCEVVPEWEVVHAACEQLVAEGVLQHAGRDGYEATEEFMAENGWEE